MLTGYILVGGVLCAVIISCWPLAARLVKKKIRGQSVSDASTAAQVGRTLKLVLIVGLLLGTGFGLMTPEFRDLLGWIAEKAKTIFELVKSYFARA